MSNEKRNEIITQASNQEEREILYSSDKGVKTKKTLIGKYYNRLLCKKPLIWLLIIGGCLGCFLSILTVSGTCSISYEGGILCWSKNWWWIPLYTLFIGPVGLVFIALILPILPYIIFIIFWILIHLGS